MALVPRTVQNMPDCLQREPITALPPPSDHRSADRQALAIKLGYRMHRAFRRKCSASVPELLRGFDGRDLNGAQGGIY